MALFACKFRSLAFSASRVLFVAGNLPSVKRERETHLNFLGNPRRVYRLVLSHLERSKHFGELINRVQLLSTTNL